MLLDETMDGLRSALDTAAQKTADAFESTRSMVDRSKMRAQLNEAYRKLGKAEYDAAVNGVSSMAEINALISEITVLRQSIAEIERSLHHGTVPFCPYCGKQSTPDDAFCSACGTRLAD